MAPRSDGFEVIWAITAPARGWVEVRPADGGPTRRFASDRNGFTPQGTEVLRVRTEGLDPGRTHEVRTVTVGTDEGHDDTPVLSLFKRVRTLDPDAANATFVAWNDTHQNPETLRLLDERSPRADVWVWNGDICNNWRDPAELAPTVLSPAGLDVTEGRPMVLSWGNHDVRGRWAYRMPEFAASPNDLPYFAFRNGPVATIVLCTGEDKPDDHPSFRGRVAHTQLRQRQAAWLAEQIHRPGFVDAPYRVVFCHMPLRWKEEVIRTEDDYASGEWDHYSRVSRELWHDSLVAWGAQVVISGHTHEQGRIDPTADFPYTQVVGGGNTPDIATWIEGSADPDRLRVRTHRLEDGSIADQVEFSPIS
jgi:hypothetical protein